MKHAFEQKVFYSDTDAYGVVWHGSYLRWLEMGRVLFCEEENLSLTELKKQDVVLPVVELKINYKKSAKLDDTVKVLTEVQDYGRFYITFHQQIVDESENNVYIDATVKVVAIDESGKLYRSLPEQILKVVEKNVQKKEG